MTTAPPPPERSTHLVVDQLRTMARTHPTGVGLHHVDSGRSLTFEHWHAEAARLARGLVTRGLRPDDLVALHIDTHEPCTWVIAYAAVHMAGAVAVPTNTRLAGSEIRVILGHAEVAAAITSDPAGLAAAAPRSLRRLVATPGVRPAGRAVPWEAVLSDDSGEFQVARRADDLADVMYTSGTTGRPKGVAVRHANASMLPHGEPSFTGDGWLHSSPLFTFAGLAFVYTPMKLGMTTLYLSRFDADAWLDAVEQRRPTSAFLVPSMAQLLLHHPRFAGADLSSLHLCTIGSAPLAPDTLQRFQAKLPNATVANSYGMTEAGPAYCSMPGDEARKRIGSVGRPMAPLEVRIVDEAGADVARGSTGEILLRTAGKPREYYREREATDVAWAGGWLHTGDLGHLDDDGYLYLSGRAKEVIIRGGNNVHAVDVEDALLAHPAVQEAAVVGVAHPVLGEEIAAFVVRVPGATVDAGELDAHCRGLLAAYKIPRVVEFTEALPRNATGKVRKADLPLPRLPEA